MKRKLFLSMGLLTFMLSATLPQQVVLANYSFEQSLNQYVNMPDSNLRKIINERYLKQPADAEITILQLRKLTGTLYLGSLNISDITGLEHCVGITGLYLSYNKIKDITPLKNLKKLTRLNITNQDIDSEEVGIIKDNRATVDNVVVDINGNNVVPVANKEYSYDKLTNKVTFNNVTEEGQKTYKFNQKVTYGRGLTTYFSGNVNQNLVNGN